MKLERCFNIAALRDEARRRLPRPVFDYMDGGADDEVTLARNRSAFSEYELLPKVLNDVSRVDMSTTVFERKIDWPVMLSPTGLTRLFHPEAELAVAQAAGAMNIPYCLSTMGTTSIEDIGAASPAPKLFQLYIFRDRGLTLELIERARAAGHDGIVLTADVATQGNRERCRRSGMAVPIRFTLSSLLSFATHPQWSLPTLFGPKFEFANIMHRVDNLGGGSKTMFDFVDEQFDQTLNWADVEWLAAQWGGPLAVKGIMTVDDARRAVDSGATSVIVSNHGGRQLDGAPAVISQIPAIAEAVRDKATIICDGGVRRGTDIAKALALGAHACSIGRPYLYGLAAGGRQGVERALTLLRQEFDRAMRLMGTNAVSQLTGEVIRKRER